MKRIALAAVVALLLAACSGPASVSTDPVEVTTTSALATPSTMGVVSSTPAGDTAATCDAIKVALFDLDSELESTFAAADPDSAGDLSEAEAAAMLFGPVLGFYDSLSDIATMAPGDVAGDLSALSDAVEPLADAFASGDPDEMEGLLGDADRTDLTFEGAGAVDDWTSEKCGIDTSLDPSVLLVDTMFSAMFSGLGDALSELGSGLEELGDLEDGPGSEGADQIYGDDPELDTLWDRCEADDDAACDDLYWRTFGLYELFSQTCGGRAPYHPNSGGSCESRMDLTGPTAYGDDDYLDSLWETCEEGDDFSCDVLAGSAPLGSAYVDFGHGCGGRRAVASDRACQNPDEPFTHGDDPELDDLWDGCVAGDGDACSDLWFESPIGSVYETVGDACGALVDAGKTCALVEELLELG